MVMEKAASLYLWTATFAMYHLANVLESMYAQQRLYMMTSDVKSDLCFNGFGNPSDETAMNWFVHTTLYLLCLQKLTEKFFESRQFLRGCVSYAWPVFGVAYLCLHMFALVLLGANAFNQVLFGASLGFTLAVIGHYWLQPWFLELQSKLMKKCMTETEHGDEVYEDRYNLCFKHFVAIFVCTLALPVCIAVLVLESFHGEIDDDFKMEVILQKVWLGNECEIDTSDASEIL